jgi:hypothetical protein
MNRSNVYQMAERRSEWPVAHDNIRRFRPFNGQLLTLRNIHGPWRPSGAIDACGMFAVVWTTVRGEFWAALHDFAPADQLTLVDMCRRGDREAGYPGAWQEGRR